MSKNFSSISQVLSSSALEQKKNFEAILPRPDLYQTLDAEMYYENIKIPQDRVIWDKFTKKNLLIFLIFSQQLM
jgi:hypothetical protein